MNLLPAQTLSGVNRIHHTYAMRLLTALSTESIDCIVTDPPYGCGTQVSARRKPEDRFKEIVGAEEIDASWIPNAYRVLKTGGAAYVFAKWVNMGEWKALLEQGGFSVRNCIIWDKLQHGTGDLEGDYAPQYEMILYATKGRHKLRGARIPNIIRYPKVQPQNLKHPYEKPVGLLEMLIRKSSDAGGVVLDLFAGSGATLRAAQQSGRKFIGSELEAEYTELIRKSLTLDYVMPMFADAA